MNLGFSRFTVGSSVENTPKRKFGQLLFQYTPDWRSQKWNDFEYIACSTATVLVSIGKCQGKYNISDF